ncbi:uncharacterized protein LOC134876262 isoform X2 [Eleginops maclovinus]|uniref:uncharacterized protein LOC134876262 isoform X2 n=1 Tax=Eleginops maclovinus TaxID=56733 RepID=UPI0030802918
MENFTLIAAVLLCSLSWISASVTPTVEVHPGEEVTLLCPNISQPVSLTEWFRVINRTKPSCVSSLYGADGKVLYCEGTQNGKFEMSSNLTTVFLKIKKVDVSDSGLYFCGFYRKTHTVISTAIQLNIGEDPDGMAYLMSLILGCLAVFFMVAVMVLAVKISKLQKAAKEELHAERNKNVGSDDLNRTEWRFLPKTIRSRRSAAENDLETHVVYAATK